MKKNVLLRLVFVLIITLLLLWATISAVLGQEPSESTLPEPTAEPIGLSAAGDVSAMSLSTNTMNYQGYLANSSGTPLEGAHTLTFSLYLADTMVWGPETHNNVQLNKGLFSVVLGSQLPLTTTNFKESLLLEVGVDGVVLSAKQPVRPVASAFSLVPGAYIEGDPSSTHSDPFGGRYYNLVVRNDRNVTNLAGIYAYGVRYGLRAKGGNLPFVNDNIAIYADDFIDAKGYISRDPSYWWTPGMRGISDGGLMSLTHSGTANLTRGSAGAATFYLPIEIPSSLYGQEVIVKDLTLYYYVSSGSSIASVRLEKLTGANTSDTLINSSVSLASTTATSYTIATSGSYTMTAASGSLNVELGLTHGGAPNNIYIGGVRLRLAHDDGQLPSE